MRAYYNEFDPKAATWLRELIAADLIAPGDVDERSITEVRPDDLRGYAQCHFFAGIGGWSYALRLAGWPDDRPVWTGSCPCQPFSAAGKRLGTDDPRHLWPEFFRLIRECRPDTVFGEQVTGAIGHGWLDLVCADLEAEGYACGAVVLGAHSVGAPHIRQRLYWVAESDLIRSRTYAGGAGASVEASARQIRAGFPAFISDGCGPTRGLGHADESGPQGRIERGDGTGECVAGPASVAGGVGNAEGDEQWWAGQREEGDGRPGSAGGSGAWGDLAWLPCRDGKARPTQPGLFPLAHGVPGRVGLLRGYGNAIVPQVAAEFIRVYQAVTTGGER